MKIFLVSAPNENAKREFFHRERSYPLGLAYLASILEKNKHLVKIFDFFHKPQYLIEKKFLEEINSENPDIIGFSIKTMNRTASFDLIKKIKKRHPEIKIMVGGVHCSTLYEQILNNYPVDVVCIGEAEGTINKIVDNIHSGNLESVEGIAFKKNGKIIRTNPPKTIMDLDSLPFPKHEAFLTKKSKTAYMITSRGCPARCVFCSTSAYWRFWRARSPKNVVDEIDYIKNKFPNIKNIFFHDDSFNINNQRVIDICKEIIKRKIKINWRCNMRVHPISLKMLKWMKKAGCNFIAFGVESGSKKMLEYMQKFISREQIIRAFNLAKNVKIKAEPFLLVGLPGESDETINETINLLKKINFAAHSIAALELYPNTQVYELAKKQGFISDSYWLTSKKVPLYTYEHTLPELTRMRFRVVYESFKNKGIFYLFLFFLKKLIFEPKLTFINIKNALFTK